mmetsp:Transcript_71450/g.165242  ORF Transcript_71450/g.165242 Transcript_71450/m.165242 type:complete len:117 (-) Transcript_71450:160-510(-)
MGHEAGCLPSHMLHSAANRSPTSCCNSNSRAGRQEGQQPYPRAAHGPAAGGLQDPRHGGGGGGSEEELHELKPPWGCMGTGEEGREGREGRGRGGEERRGGESVDEQVNVQTAGHH